MENPEEILINKNYYSVKFNIPWYFACNEKTKKKLVKILYKTKNEVEKLIYENKDDIIDIDWSLANVIDNNGKIIEQKTFYYAKPETHRFFSLEESINGCVGIDVRKLDIYNTQTEEQLNEIKKLLTEELEEEILYKSQQNIKQ